MFTDEADKRDRILNTFASQSFRDQADRDYIVARMACRAELMPQFLAAAQQAVEKYLKAILLYNRVPAADVGHDIDKALQRALQIEGPGRISLGRRSRAFLTHLVEQGAVRYLEAPYVVDGHPLIDLDVTVGELRRHCQVLNVFGKELPAQEQAALEQALAELAESLTQAPPRVRIAGGFLEKVLETPRHPARAALVWQNAMFSTRRRSSVKAQRHLQWTSPILFSFPEMVDAVAEYAHLPKPLIEGYKQHSAQLKREAAIPETNATAG